MEKNTPLLRVIQSSRVKGGHFNRAHCHVSHRKGEGDGKDLGRGKGGGRRGSREKNKRNGDGSQKKAHFPSLLGQN